MRLLLELFTKWSDMRIPTIKSHLTTVTCSASEVMLAQLISVHLFRNMSAFFDWSYGTVYGPAKAQKCVNNSK